MLIEKLEQVKQKNKDNFNKTGDRDYAVAIGVTQHCINIVKQHSDWISVDERLPNDDEWVLAYSNNSNIHVVMRTKWEDTKDEFFYLWEFQDLDGYLSDEEITYWQPLPQPPK